MAIFLPENQFLFIFAAWPLYYARLIYKVQWGQDFFLVKKKKFIIFLSYFDHDRKFPNSKIVVDQDPYNIL